MSTAIDDIDQTSASLSKPAVGWQSIAVSLATLALLVLALGLRLHNLGLLFDRDSYDEGVYWQSLRAMSAGNTLYNQVFCSQPPFFLLSVYPIYMLAGQTIWAARLGVALFSLSGYAGAFLFGHVVSGRMGALVAVFFLVTDPLFLSQSQRLQAEAPSVALSFLAVGLIYAWWRSPRGVRALGLVALSGVAFTLSILGKLFGVATLAPIVLVMILYLIPIWRRAGFRPALLAIWLPVLLFALACLVTAAVLIGPFLNALPQFWQEVVSLHTARTAASAFYIDERAETFGIMDHLLFGSILALAALCGIILSALRRDWRVLPVLTWLLATIVMLLLHVPLFDHHLISLIPPMISLAVISLSAFPWETVGEMVRTRKPRGVTFSALFSVLAALIVLVALFLNVLAMPQYYLTQRRASAAGVNRQISRIANDVRTLTTADQLVITDAQFIVGVADRNTPASLVDTSNLRADTGYLTAQQLIEEASRPEVHALLIYSGRLNNKKLAAFHDWYVAHFRIAKDYGKGRALWIKS